MVDFVTLFLGLVVGSHPVEVSVGAEVARVELLVDGERADLVEGPPWVGEVDFGPELLPHTLEAVARDAGGRELGRGRQLVNAPRELAEATLALEPGSGGEGRAARLAWRSTEHSHPAEVAVSFDGQPLEVGDLHRIELPAYDPQSLHFLRAELTFSPMVQAQAELVVGGLYGEAVATDLAAVLMTGKKRAARLEALAGHLARAGDPLRLTAVEQGPRDLVVVREKSELLMGNMASLGVLPELLEKSAPRTQTTRLGVRLAGVRSLRLEGGDSLRFVFPSVRSSPGPDAGTEVVPVSLDVAELAGGDLMTLLGDYFFPREDIPFPEQRLADAVAVAGVRAAARDRRRAVVLILAGDSRDRSLHSAAEVRRFLDALQVPLFVWAPLEVAVAAGVEPWGEVDDISDAGGFRKAISRLREALDEQWVVWAEGRFLPHEVVPVGVTDGLELLGREGG